MSMYLVANLRQLSLLRLCVYIQFLSGVEAWCKMCSEGGLPSEMQDLERAIHHHQTLYEQVTQAYTEVRSWPKYGKLLYLE